ncbi:MAG: hypothetical protein L3J41_02165 [Melioribacteraceae bacterium]|nr:hypothetical protein [Melioribacteraceae bacterium]
MITQNEKTQNMMTSELALQFLKDGNARFCESKRLERDYNYQVVETSDGQFPFAIILSCIDSRVPTEIIFDKGIGDLFNARIAGNIVNKDILGSMEFACKLSGAKLILVLGHTSCGAVKGAYNNTELGNLTGLLEKLKPAINSVTTNSESKDFLDIIALKNVELTIDEIKNQSSVLNEMYKNKEIDIKGAMYDVRSGKVTFLE